MPVDGGANIGLKAVLKPEFDEGATKKAVGDLEDDLDDAATLNVKPNLSKLRRGLKDLGLDLGGVGGATLGVKAAKMAGFGDIGQAAAGTLGAGVARKAGFSGSPGSDSGGSIGTSAETPDSSLGSSNSILATNQEILKIIRKWDRRGVPTRGGGGSGGNKNSIRKRIENLFGGGGAGGIASSVMSAGSSLGSGGLLAAVLGIGGIAWGGSKAIEGGGNIIDGIGKSIGDAISGAMKDVGSSNLQLPKNIPNLGITGNLPKLGVVDNLPKLGYKGPMALTLAVPAWLKSFLQNSPEGKGTTTPSPTGSPSESPGGHFAPWPNAQPTAGPGSSPQGKGHGGWLPGLIAGGAGLGILGWGSGLFGRVASGASDLISGGISAGESALGFAAGIPSQMARFWANRGGPTAKRIFGSPGTRANAFGVNTSAFQSSGVPHNRAENTKQNRQSDINVHFHNTFKVDPSQMNHLMRQMEQQVQDGVDQLERQVTRSGGYIR